MDKKASSVTASCNGVTKDLLSIRELTNGDLLLTLKNAEYLIEIGRKKHRVVEQRYLLRLESRARQVIVTHSLRISSGRIVTIASWANEAHASRTWPIFSRLVPDLRPGRFDFRSRPSNGTINMADYDPCSMSLCYCVIAHRHQKISHPAAGQSTAIAHLWFREFDITVVSRVLDHPSTDGALVHHSGHQQSAGADEHDVMGIMEYACRQLTLARERPIGAAQAIH